MQVKCPLNVTIAVYNSDWKGRRLGNTISIWNAWKLAGILLARWPRETHVLQKSLQKFNTQKRAFKLNLVCMCILMWMCVCTTSTVPGWPKCQGWVMDAVPAQGQAHPHQLTPSSLASLAPCWEPQPVSSAASISCLQEGPAVTPFFHFLWRPWCFREADYSRLVAMADCFCCCPSPCWPHQSEWKSTGPLKPLIEFMVYSI